jgi:hypothetical protein
VRELIGLWKEFEAMKKVESARPTSDNKKEKDTTIG